ncbi:FtsK/SpoIIIE domain-containing protein [Schinkia azotoformans]|uniref:Cell division protein FtsK/SpoIIIE n=1 Tax=Schinkia azotoformans LMG 9581 TaxID=1131731 RepID=K6DGX1_SCHAZ|nr:FtsK/SpoIIIE domain-containing protein [Schinkia azotoformans]EKN67524.1 cell division protein FtsK/SpoIIIE [Schinkia azotoformans LMG 9581]MEC1637315.1 FtsK/SpoIIIE domain-containing protein [Schinkia azotoformans]MEC1943719.1 FtsK/SpoIIIE domain-containing protein [Schinkia azotoformans]
MFDVLLASGVLAGSFYIRRGGTDAQRIQRICRKAGLYVKYDGKEDTMKLLRSKRGSNFIEYVFRIPEGLSSKDFIKKKDVIEDGLNTSKNTVLLYFKKEKSERKEIEISFDKVLKIKVFNKPMPELVPYENSAKGWNVPIGQSRSASIYHDFEKIPHIVVAGTTRYGKSVFLKNAITTLIVNQSGSVTFTLIDLKGGLTFNRYRTCKQVLTVASDTESALEALREIKANMQQVMDHLMQLEAENVQEAGRKDRHFIVVDEAAQIASAGETDREIKKMKVECEQIISEIARIGGALGFRIIYATQYPTADTLPRQVKQNCDAKLCFKLQTDVASQVVLDETGAESLPFIKGRAIYLTDRKHIVQTPFIENKQIEDLIEERGKR